MGFTDQTALISSLLDRADAFVVVLDSYGRIVRVNVTFEEACGVPAEEIKGKDFCEQFLASGEAIKIRLRIQHPEQSQIPQKLETSCIFADGSQTRILWWTSPLFDRHLSLEYIILTGLISDDDLHH